jgi:hypothetical protein
MRKERLSTVFLAVSGLVFVAGVVAVLVVFLGNTADPVESTLTNTETGAAVVPAQRQAVRLDPAARRVAAEFITTAVAREDLARAYELTHPDLRQGFTKQEWVEGDIPVQYYPATAIDKATMKIDESYPDEAVLEVALLPKQGAKIKPQIFFVGLKKTGGRWQVYYFAPRGAPALPTQGEQ